MSERSAENEAGLHTCPECGTQVDRASGYPYWVDAQTKQRHHDPCPTDEDRAEWGLPSPPARRRPEGCVCPPYARHLPGCPPAAAECVIPPEEG